ncbi:hypothetical protein AC16_4940 [Escherichia coli 2-177-06_S3_C2]|nr:hypothetical protein AC16_4940 [Escherichia coli 2-177-06_S3_C2]
MKLNRLDNRFQGLPGQSKLISSVDFLVYECLTFNVRCRYPNKPERYLPASFKGKYLTSLGVSHLDH